MNRRRFLAAAGAASLPAVAGCQTLRTDPEPAVALSAVRTLRPHSRAAVVVAAARKDDPAEAHVRLRAELVFEERYDHAKELGFTIPDEVVEESLGVVFEYDGPFLEGATYSSRARIIRDDAADGPWVAEARSTPTA